MKAIKIILLIFIVSACSTSSDKDKYYIPFESSAHVAFLNNEISFIHYNEIVYEIVQEKFTEESFNDMLNYYKEVYMFENLAPGTEYLCTSDVHRVGNNELIFIENVIYTLEEAPVGSMYEYYFINEFNEMNFIDITLLKYNFKKL